MGAIEESESVPAAVRTDRHSSSQSRAGLPSGGPARCVSRLVGGDKGSWCDAAGPVVVTGTVEGTISTQVCPGCRAMVDPSDAVRVVGSFRAARFHVPVTATPLRSTVRGPLPVICDWTSRPPSLFSSHGP